MLPKRFPDRDEIATVRALAESLEPGGMHDEPEARKLAGRIMARRDMGKLVFLDLVDRSGRIQLVAPENLRLKPKTSISATSSAWQGAGEVKAPARPSL